MRSFALGTSWKRGAKMPFLTKMLDNKKCQELAKFRKVKFGIKIKNASSPGIIWAQLAHFDVTSIFFSTFHN